jgi:hypothetical protein
MTRDISKIACAVKNEIAGALCAGDFFHPRFPAHALHAVNTAARR